MEFNMIKVEDPHGFSTVFLQVSESFYTCHGRRYEVVPACALPFPKSISRGDTHDVFSLGRRVTRGTLKKAQHKDL